MSKKQKCLFALALALGCAFVVPQTAYAMHVAEGYLPVGHCIAWGALCIPFVAAGMMKISKVVKQQRKALLILAMAGAYAFVLSALKIPSATGSSSHPTGTGLGALLFGPTPMAVLGLIVLLFQAILLAHGGLSTLGANTFSMAIAGPFFSYGIYLLCKRCRVNRKASIFLAACLGDLFTYCVTSLQLGLSHPGSVGVWASCVEFLSVFALTQIPLAIIEGILTVIIMIGFEAYAQPELEDLGFLKGGSRL